MSSNSVCNQTRDQQIRLPLRGRSILFITLMIVDIIGLHSVLIPISILVANFTEVDSRFPLSLGLSHR